MSGGHPTLSVVGWDTFQHYSKRDPPWIKVHRQLLDNYAWARLQDASKAHLVGIWLLAARHHNVIPADPVWIAQRIGATEPVDLHVLVEQGFLEVASGVLADRKQNSILETEAETETEAENSVAAAPPKKRQPSRTVTTVKETWLTPYWEAWNALGGSVSPGQLAKALRPMHDLIGPERGAQALTAWLEAGNAKYGPMVFARDWRTWAGEGLDPTLTDVNRKTAKALAAWRDE